MKSPLPAIASCLTAIWLLFSALPTLAQSGQSREFRGYFSIGKSHSIQIKKPVAAPQPTLTLPAGSVVVKRNATIITRPNGAPIVDSLRQTRTLKSDSIIYAKPAKGAKPAEDDVCFQPTRRYRANVVQAKDTLYLNYQLFPEEKPKAAAVVAVPCEPAPTNCQNRLTRLFKKSCRCYAALPGSPLPPTRERTKVCGFPDCMFDRKNTYYIKLHDRQAAVFSTRAIELAALTIPFQYRPGFTVDNVPKPATPTTPATTVSVPVPGQLNTSLGLAAYGGVKFGWTTFRYRKQETLAPNKISVSIGPFLGITRVALDKTNTRLASTTKTDTVNLYRNIAALSLGGAVLFDVYDFRVGLLYGNDIGIGSKQWDFDRRWWWGVGIGYKLPFFTKNE